MKLSQNSFIPLLEAAQAIDCVNRYAYTLSGNFLGIIVRIYEGPVDSLCAEVINNNVITCYDISNLYINKGEINETF